MYVIDEILLDCYKFVILVRILVVLIDGFVIFNGVYYVLVDVEVYLVLVIISELL